MQQFLAEQGLWKELRSITKNRKGRVQLAVPYLGKGAGKLLYLRRGDSVVVELTLGNSRSGSVCPDEIALLQKRGIQVFVSRDLHAKVLLCGRKVVIGSANLTKNSFNTLDEAAILTTDKSVVRKVRSWFDDRLCEEVTPQWLEKCRKAYRPPRNHAGRNDNKMPPSNGVWLLKVEYTDFPAAEAEAVERGRIAAEKKMIHTRGYQVEQIRWTGSAKFLEKLRAGDTVIQIVTASNTSVVEEHSRLIFTRRTKTRRGAPVTYIHLESRMNPKVIRWQDFKARCRPIGLQLSGNTLANATEVSNPIRAKKVVRIASRARQ